MPNIVQPLLTVRTFFSFFVPGRLLSSLAIHILKCADPRVTSSPLRPLFLMSADLYPLFRSGYFAPHRAVKPFLEPLCWPSIFSDAGLFPLRIFLVQRPAAQRTPPSRFFAPGSFLIVSLPVSMLDIDGREPEERKFILCAATPQPLTHRSLWAKRISFPFSSIFPVGLTLFSLSYSFSPAFRA